MQDSPDTMRFLGPPAARSESPLRLRGAVSVEPNERVGALRRPPHVHDSPLRLTIRDVAFGDLLADQEGSEITGFLSSSSQVNLYMYRREFNCTYVRRGLGTRCNRT